VRRLGFGIVGCGAVFDFHAKSIAAIDNIYLAGVADVNKEKREEFAERYGTRSFDSYEQMLESKDVDVVSICTPSGLHAPLAIQAAKAGKHIIVEKPMALTVKEADDMIEACEQNNVKLTVISQLRFSEATTRLKAAINEGLLGKLLVGTLSMKYFRSQEYYDQSTWRGTWKMDGGGALINQGIHGVDLFQYMLGDVKSVFAHARTMVRNIETEDTAVAILEFENGALGTIEGTTSVYPGFPRMLEINGSKGTIALEEDSIIKWVIEGQDVPEDLVLGARTNDSSSDPTAFAIDGHRRQIEDMANAIWEDRKPLIDQYEGKKPVEIITAIYESSRTGKPVILK
jgi:UDP-N-acetyl-2-amino-2-deoxyglucuronate dehydrogenase